MNTEEARRATELHTRQFLTPPDGVWSAPGRANLIGEHTDYNLGLALPFAINHRTYTAMSVRDDRVIHVVSESNPGEHIQWSLDGDTPSGLGWASYPLGVLSLLAPENAPGLNISIASNVPLGAGLSSSAALECAVATAARDLWNTSHTDRELAALGTIAENDIVGAPTGTMDQLASMLGQQDHAIAIDFYHETTTSTPLRVSDHGLHLVIIDSGQRHDHASGDYGQRRQGCASAAKLLEVASLRDITPESLQQAEQRLSAEHAGLVRHVVYENARVLDTIDALAHEDMARVGELLTASHTSLRDDFRVSTPYIDAIVETCLTEGALGGRLVGGGFGGAVLALVPENHFTKIHSTIEQTPQAPAALHPPTVRSVTPSAGAGQDA